MKDYYQTLELAASATKEEIKKSFRRLAHEYHPDKNTTNAFAEARFREIHEAYTVLSNDDKRALYDQDRWLSGRFKKNASILTPDYFLKEIQRLNAHLLEVDVYRMNKQMLNEYLLFLLSDDKEALLIQKATPETIQSISHQILQSVSYLPAYFALPVLEKWLPVAIIHSATHQSVISKIVRIKKDERLRKAYPWLIVVVTLFILIAMYYFSKR